jgi:hypothetical protein
MQRHESAERYEADIRIIDDQGYACVICVPNDLSKTTVELFATEAHDQSRYGKFEAIDVATIPIDVHRYTTSPTTPHPCECREGCTHWFLMAYR